MQKVQASVGAFAAILAQLLRGAIHDMAAMTLKSAISSAVSGRFRPQNSAIAAILSDGSVAAWGNRFCGGDTSAVQGQLRKVQQIQATERAFAALLEDGSVVAWGNPDFGGDNSAIVEQLRYV